MEGLPLLQEFSCAENHLPKVDGLANCSLLQHLRLSQNNLQLVIINRHVRVHTHHVLCRGGVPWDTGLLLVSIAISAVDSLAMISLDWYIFAATEPV